MFKKNSQYGHKTVPLLTYWTRFYLLVLLLSLLGIVAISGVWVWINTYNHHFDLLELQALQLAEVYERSPGEGAYQDRPFRQGPLRMGPVKMSLLVQMVDQQGIVFVVSNDRRPFDILSLQQETPSSYKAVLAGNSVRERVEIDKQTWLRVGIPITWNGTERRALYVSYPTRGVLEQILRLYSSLALITCIIGLASWLVLYFLSKKLTRPLLQVADATRSIAEGKYDVDLPQQLKEQELQQMVTSFKDMAAQLKKLEQLRSSLLAGVSHELRTPITSIRGMIQAVQSKVVEGEEAEKFLRISLAEAKRLQQMVEELLDFSSIEAGATQMDKEEVELSTLVEEVIQQLLFLPEYSSIRFERHLSAGPVWVRGDAGRLRQVILNLFNNSLKASAEEIRLNLYLDGHRVILDVEDNGKGIIPEEQPYIFERFYRGGEGKVKVCGLGLGLTISRLLARDHGGDLTLIESSSKGTLFRLSLPGSNYRGTGEQF